MKLNDIIGFAAILGAGYYVGVHVSSVASPQDFVNTAAWSDWIIVLGLLVFGFYFAVVLS